MAKNLLLLIFLYSTTIWAQKPTAHFDDLYIKTLTETASKDASLALKIADSLTAAAKTPEIKGRSLMLTSQIYLQKTQYEKSIEFAEKAKDILNTTENYELQAKVRGLLSNEYRQIALNHKSKDYLNDGLKIADKIKDIQKKYQVKALFCQELANIEADAKRYPNAVKYLQQSLKYLSEIPQDSINIGLNNQMLGELYGRYLNNYKLSEIHYLQALKFLPKSNMNTGVSYVGLGKIKFSQKKYTEAEKFYLKALEYAEVTDIPEMKRHTAESLAELYEQTKDYKKASFYRKKQNENINKIQGTALEFIDKNYSKIEKEKDKYASWNSIKNTVISIASLLILSLIIVFIINKKKQKEEYSKFKSIIAHYKEKEEYVLDSKFVTSEIDDNEAEEENISEEINIENKQNDIAINKETEAKILEQLDHFEKDEMYNNSYISLSFLATEFNTNIRYISFVVKKHKAISIN